MNASVPSELQRLRPDPIELQIQQESGRMPWLEPVRHSLMAESPFAFYRGAAEVIGWSDLMRSTGAIRRASD